jgi:hypothetical protein
LRRGCRWLRVIEQVDEFFLRCVGQPMGVHA